MRLINNFPIINYMNNLYKTEIISYAYIFPLEYHSYLPHLLLPQEVFNIF